MSQLSVTLVGFGLAGRTFHAPVIMALPGLKLDAVITSQVDAVASVVPGATVYPTLEARLAAGTPDLVVIATPNELHYPQARAALEAGAHVVVDKPFTVTLEEADALIALAAERKLVLSTFQNRRWDGDFLTVCDLIRSGKLGQVVEFHSRFDRFRPEVRDRWREKDVPGGGLLYDLGPHLLDQAFTLFGPASHLSGGATRQRPGGIVDDSFSILSIHGEGEKAVRCVLNAGMLYPVPGPRYTIYGTNGVYTVGGTDPQEDQLKAGMVPTDAGYGEAPEAEWGTLTHVDGRVERIPTKRGNYADYYAGVAAAIRGEAPVPVPAEAGRATITAVLSLMP
ncbi:Gfo/Idh/MocA family oxidoreductase [Radicibacter daui]|uniref:Gfo/Idh/MocA family oxidoreductase n=1 Tax=Radicibacter daui TaxID=3064829 RepID=UPI004046F3EE